MFFPRQLKPVCRISGEGYNTGHGPFALEKEGFIVAVLSAINDVCIYCFGGDAFFAMFFMDTQPIDIIGLKFFSLNVAIEWSRGHGRKELIIGKVHRDETMVLFVKIFENGGRCWVIGFILSPEIMVGD